MRKNEGFVLADNLVGMALMTMVAIFFCLGEQQLQAQMKHAKQELYLARLAKEATAQLDIKHPQIEYVKDNYHVTATYNSVKIKRNQQRLFTVNKL
ncbi:Uncharacterized protein LACOL_1221 [Paucilactobacillus oligofermentans DSM 15707 = LMG 22743]|uniref:hypothetical protein n=1 Tax=Paucilactobacillus oligofermentans TaxID=293371 RepID=UPI00070AF1D5|nr:hypothetical protein [Paucilactobacillus oligofermentans]CUS26529.1 Uncharacterized protein LACOL_1221 [Paucilactobacillus oligofermentans DSM 15707 = LMG 22743]